MTTTSPWRQRPRPGSGAPPGPPRGKTSDPDPDPDGLGPTGPDVVGTAVHVDGPIVSFSPSDGVFLRAEHLDQITDHARALGAALGRAGGSGVVYGYGVGLDSDGEALQIRPGLAINREGEPLQSGGAAVLPLSASHLPVTAADGFAVLEVVPDRRRFGSEPTYGAVCADPCSGGQESAVTPWTMEGVAFRLRADEMPGLSGVDPVRQRSWLASQYFERERATADPWLVPGLSPHRVPAPATRSWDEPRGAELGRAVPLAVVLRIADRWVLDVWTARRDLGRPPGTGSWQDRLAMRPWSVFVAQLLQFQDQISSTSVPPPVVDKTEVVDERAGLTEAFLRAASQGSLGNRKDVRAFEEAYRKADPAYVLASSGGDLGQLGFDELPPAGYLPHDPTDQAAQVALRALFAAVDVRICRARADHIVTAVAAAQHLDRIPLSGQYGRPQVDLLVPTEPADLAPLRAEAYGWVAFVRRTERDCGDPDPEPPGPDRVPLLLAPRYDEELLKALREGDVPPEVVQVDVLDYPTGQADLPPGAQRPDLDDDTVYHAIAVADSAGREELMTKRAEVVVQAWSLQGQAVGAGVGEHAPSALLVLAPVQPG